MDVTEAYAILMMAPPELVADMHKNLELPRRSQALESRIEEFREELTSLAYSPLDITSVRCFLNKYRSCYGVAYSSLIGMDERQTELVLSWIRDERQRFRKTLN